MPYEAEISRSNPTAFLFLIDQSGSMADRLPNERTKAEQVADVVNRTLANLIVRCTRSDGTLDYFYAGVLGYGGGGVQNGFAAALGDAPLHPISAIEAHPLEIQARRQRQDDGAGGIVEQEIRFPVWFEPVADGGTPMREAILHATEALAEWCDAHLGGYPPTVLHITDGESTDGEPGTLAETLRSLGTEDGNVLLFNLHVSSTNAEPIRFPASEASLPDEYAKLLFRMSSSLPRHLLDFAKERGINVNGEARGFMFNADAVSIVDFFDIGTRASQLR